MGGKSKSPKSPDLIGAANATAEGNIRAARVAADANRINQFTPFGSQTFTHGTGDDRDVWTSKVTLTPQQQKILDLNTATGRALAQFSKDSLGAVSRATRTPFNKSLLPAKQINAGQTAQDAIMSRLEPAYQRRQADLDTQLANQGIARGSEAANRAYDDLGRERTDAYQQAALRGIDVGQQARQQAIQEQEFFRTEPLSYLNMLRNGGQATMPQFQAPGSQQATTGPDILGATNGMYQNQLGAYNAQQAGSNNLMNGLFGLGGAAMLAPTGTFSGLAGLFSDRRLKTNIKRIGEYHGHNVYEYDIFGRHEIGVMAQEVMRTRPDAVAVHPSGFLMVNYGAL